MSRNLNVYKSHQLGFSLLELSVMIILIGVLSTITSVLYRINVEKSRDVHFNQLTDPADHAILGFIFAYGRLPCPASSLLSGIEDCTIKVGYYPHKSLGLTHSVLNSFGLPLRYAVYSKPGLLEDNIELDKVVDRFRPFIADVWSGSTLFAQLQTLNNANSLDFCQAIQSGYTVDADVSYLLMGNGVNAQPVAYLLFSSGNEDADGSGTLLDGANTPSGVTFENLNAAGNALNDDQLKAVHFSDLWEQLGCNGVVSVTGHAHPNAVTSAVILQQSLADYKIQLDIAVDIANADVASAASAVAGAVSAAADAAAGAPIGTANSINTKGLEFQAVAASKTAIGLATASSFAAGALVTKAALNRERAKELYKEVDPLISQINALALTIRNNALAADSAGLFER